MGLNATSVGARRDDLAAKAALAVPPALRRATALALRPECALPALAAVLLLLCFVPTFGSALRDGREARLNEALVRTDLLLRAAADGLRRPGTEGLRAGHLEDLVARGLPAGALGRGATLVLFDARGQFVAAAPRLTVPVRSAADLFGEAAPVTILADRAGAMTVNLPDGRDAIGALRTLPQGQLAVVQPLADLSGADGPWLLRPEALASAAGLTILALLGALGSQAQRTRTVRDAGALLRRRTDTALARGRCGLWDWDISRGRVSWSASMYDLLGFDRRDDDLSFGEVNGMIHPADGDLYHLAERLASQPALQLEHDFRMRNTAGGWLWLRARAEVVTEGDGSRHLVGIAVDITDERGFVERHAAADARLRDAVEAVSEAFVLWDAQNRLVLCNSKFRNLHGLGADKARAGATYAEIMAGSRPPVVEHQLALENAEDPGARALEAQLSDGRWLQINERRTRDGGYVSVGTDITALKRQEKRLLESERQLIGSVTDLKRSRETLQHQAQQLAELAELHLEQKSQAETANRSKTDFLAKMSHELRTPLNAIIGFAEVMQHQMFGTLGNPRYLGYANDIQASGLYLLSVINDILQMSRIEAGHISLSPQPIAIRGMLDRAVRVVAEAADLKSLAITVEARSDVTLHADERALNQVLAHILRNAVKFTREGGTVRVRVRPALDAVNIFVEDSGIGIPQDFLPRLGRPFEQVEAEFSRGQGGSGLGLAIAKAFAAMHGGGLRVRSQEGVGTVVLVHLPTNQPEPASRPRPTGTEPPLKAAA